MHQSGKASKRGQASRQPAAATVHLYKLHLMLWLE